MRKLALTGVVLIALVGAGTAQATEPLFATQPISTASDAALKAAIEEAYAGVDTTAFETAIPDADPAVAKKGATKAAIAGRLMPAVKTLAAVGGYALLGWYIGGEIDKYFKISSYFGAEGGTTGTCVFSDLFWDNQDDGYFLLRYGTRSGCGSTVTNGNFITTLERLAAGCTGGTASSNAICAYPTTSDPPMVGQWYEEAPNAKWLLTEAGMDTATEVEPSTLTEYNTFTTLKKISSTYTKPTYISGDATNIRTSLETGTRSSRDYINWLIDPDYADIAGYTFNMPDCIGLSEAACDVALDSAGHTGTRTYTVLTTETADAEQPADAVVTQSVPATTEVEVGATVTLQLNPGSAEMPFTVLQPLINETYTEYLTRLSAAGWLGSATTTELGTALDGYGPLSPARVVLTLPSTTRTLDPLRWPSPSPTIARDTDITVRYNPETAPEAPGTSGEPATTPTTTVTPAVPTTVPAAPAVDFGPLTDIDFGCKFPYGFLTCYAIGFTELFEVTEDAPVFSFTLGWTGMVNGQEEGGEAPYTVDLAVMDDYMSLWRTILSVCLWVGAIYFVATRFLGFNAGGDPGEAIEDVL